MYMYIYIYIEGLAFFPEYKHTNTRMVNIRELINA